MIDIISQRTWIALGVSAALSFACVAPLTTHAETVLRVGDSVTVAADQRVEEDFYAAGGTVAMSGEIVGDMYAMGGSVTANGTIAEDITAVGGTVSVHAPVGDDVRIVGGDVTIAGTVGGDVFVVAGSLTLLSSASVEGDVFFYGAEANIEGVIKGSLMGTAERFRIDSSVAGDVDITSSRPVTLGDRALIAGDVRYESFGELVRAQNAVVEGDITRNDPEQKTDDSPVGTIVTTLIVSLFAAFLSYVLFKRELQPFVQGTIKNYGRSGVLGIAIVVLAPVGAVLLMVTVLGLLVGIVGLLLFLLLCFVAAALAPVVVGGLIARFVTNRVEVNLMWIAVGVLALNVLIYIPIIGIVFAIGIFLLTLGNLVWVLYNLVR